ncbi:MAG: endonuclease/exonuclease/phosphatase family protein [Acidimicrobiales bacterium]
MDRLVVASFNVHGGVDGWGRPYDVLAACRLLDADVLILLETWTPVQGPGLAEHVASALGYELVTTYPMMRALLYPPAADPPARWGPLLRRFPGVGYRRDPLPDVSGSRPGAKGTVGMAVLTRIAPLRTGAEPLPAGRGEPARRAVLWVELPGGLVVAGTHVSHFRHRSIRQVRRAGRILSALGAEVVLAGDFNMWGPLVTVLLPRWRRVVRGRTWPAWRPVFAIDHVLVRRGSLTRARGEVARDAGGSDHRPVWASVTGLPD